MIKLSDISLQRGQKVLLEQASLTVNPGQKFALIGANGSGKSSLFKLLLKQLPLDSGDLFIPKNWRISHMAQEVASCDRSAIDYVIDGDKALRALEQQLATAEQENQLEKIAELHEQLDNIDGYNAKVRAEQLLLGLGFSMTEITQPVNSFSGGWRIRLNLAQALMSASDLLLLDEPTNHLDLDAELWLEQWLQNYPGTLLLISHDRDFIDSCCDGIAHLEHHQLFSYTGNYSAFEKQRAERLAQQQANYEKQQQRKSEIQDFVRRFRAKATKAKQAQSRLKELARMEEIAPAHIDSPFSFSFLEPGRMSDPTVNLTRANLGYPSKTILENISLSLHPGSRIGLLGANGAGKSTLMKTLAQDLPLVEGQLSFGEHCRIGYFSQHQLEALDFQASPVLHLQRIKPKATEQAIRNFLGGFNFHGDMATGTIKNFSGGEKARLALAIIVWENPNLLLLDEPTNHLDLDMCHALTMALQNFEGAMVIVSHDRHLLRNTVDQFLLVSDGKVEQFDDDLNAYSRWILEQRKQQKQDEKQSTDTNDNDKAVNKKEQRQQAAEKRATLKPLTQKLKKAEQLIAKLEPKLADIEEQLSDTSLYDAERKDELQKLLQEQGQLKSKLEQAEEQWFELSQELEELG